MEKSTIYVSHFVSGGTPAYVEAGAGNRIEWIEVYNETVLAAGGAGTGAKFYWDYNMDDDSAYEYQKLAADDSLLLDQIVAGGFTPYASNQTLFGAWVLIGGIGAGPPAEVQTGNTAGLYDGDVVQITNCVGAQQLSTIDYQIDNIAANVSFDLTNMPAVVAAAAPGAAAFYRKVNWRSPFYPRTRYIASVTQAAAAVVTFTVDHNMQVGQKVTFTIPAEYGMQQLNGVTATITAVAAATITLDVNSAAFAAFAFPVTADVPFSPAVATPAGTDGSVVDIDGSVVNDAGKGLILATGVDSPAGVLNDVIRIRYSITN